MPPLLCNVAVPRLDLPSTWSAVLEPWVPWLAWLGATSGLFAVLGLTLLPVLISRMRADHFVNPPPTKASWLALHPAFRLVLVGLKNLFAVSLILVGVAMLVLPGQGVLCILLGLSMSDFPGKRGLELWLLRQKPVHRTVDWIRHRAGREPLILPTEVPARPPGIAAERRAPSAAGGDVDEQ